MLTVYCKNQMPIIRSTIFVLILLPLSALAQNGDADVIAVQAIDHGTQGWTFHVTVSHPDTGWEDYCDGWDVVGPDGEVIKVNDNDRFTRLLLHPHVEEQPFTRSQGRLQIPESITTVSVRAHDIVDGFGGEEITVDLTTDSGPVYTITRN